MIRISFVCLADASAGSNPSLTFDLDLFWFAVLRFRATNREHSILVRGLDLVRIHSRGQSQTSLEPAKIPFGSIGFGFVLLLFLLPLTGNCEGASFERDFNVFLFHSRQRCLHDHVILVFVDIDRRRPPFKKRGARREKAEWILEKSTDLVANPV